MSAPFTAYEYFAPSAQEADPGAPGAAQDSSQPRVGRHTLVDWLALAGFATYAFGIGPVLAIWLEQT